MGNFRFIERGELEHVAQMGIDVLTFSVVNDVRNNIQSLDRELQHPYFQIGADYFLSFTPPLPPPNNPLRGFA